MRSINIENLLDWNKEVQEQFLKKNLKLNPTERAYSVSMIILKSFLGLDWVEKYVMDPSNNNYYLRSQSSLNHDLLRHQARVIDLGEMLLNLKNVPGIIERILALRDLNNPKYGGIEGIAAELVGAKILCIHKIPFRFILTSGVKGSDYDLEFLIKEEKVCCESKCKLEQTELTDKTILDSLKKANEQLPKEFPGVIMVSIPEKWNKESILMEKLELATKRFYGQNDKIISIIYHSDDFLFEASFTGRFILIKEIVNSNSKFGKYEEIINDIDSNTYNRNWISIVQFMKENTTY